MRRRLDSELVRRGLVVTLDQALALISAGRVLVEGAPAYKPQRQVDTGESISLTRERRRFVSRGGDKLAGALAAFSMSLDGDHVLDVGASTGGFTDVALRQGARSVVAVDVGRGQLHESLRRDPRVSVRDRTNIRLAGRAELGEFDTVVADLSFISLATVMGALAECTRPGGRLVLLVKPQFEADRGEAGHNRGVITDPTSWQRSLERTIHSASAHHLVTSGVCVSPLPGADGNIEFFVHLTRPTPRTGPGEGAALAADPGTVAAMIGGAIDRALAYGVAVEGDSTDPMAAVEESPAGPDEANEGES